MGVSYTEPSELSALNMPELAARLRIVVSEARERMLKEFNDESASEPYLPGKWSRKQILGHLIDSAANNHQRFVRLQLEPVLVLPGYEQEGWVRVQYAQERTWAELVEFWASYNLHLAHVIERIDPATLGHVWEHEGENWTLGFIVEDYIAHLQHHLRQILN